MMLLLSHPIMRPIVIQWVKMIRGSIRDPVVVSIIVPRVDVSMVAHGVRGMDIRLLMMQCWLMRLLGLRRSLMGNITNGHDGNLLMLHGR